MYFRKLELVGFKSFLEKTTLNFEPGITAIVGPNGCGKSNVFDAIRWVLGEQSAKSLRGSDMQDVIFNGTDTKEALGMAEVSLTFDNQEKLFNVEHPEVTITRRLFRSGESEYLLNKATVRLKDILDLLLGTGIGAESYSIIAQGKIDLVLSSRPEDRRLVFDEASGITKYKAQKREATRKLEETEQNLLRVNDIITEVRRQIGSLERQANKARKYKEAFEELKSKEVNLSILEKEELLKQKEQINAQLGELKTQESHLVERIREQEEKISRHQSELKSAQDSIMAIRNEILGLENQVLRNNQLISFNQERIIELKTAKGYLEEQRDQLKIRLSQDEEKLNKFKIEYDSLKENIQEKSNILSDKDSQINNLASQIKHSLDSIATAKKDILELTAKISHAKNELAEFNSQEQIYLARRKRLEIEKLKVSQEKAVTQEGLESINQEVEALTRLTEEINSRIALLHDNLSNAQGLLANLGNQVAQLEKERLTLESHKEFLEKLKTKYEDIGESLNAVIYLDKLPAEQISGLVVKIKENTPVCDSKESNFRFSGEAKPFELNTDRFQDKLKKLEEQLSNLRQEQEGVSLEIEKIKQSLKQAQDELRDKEIVLANKQSSKETIETQFNKLKEEEELIVLELSQMGNELDALKENITVSQERLSSLSSELRQREDLISKEEEAISVNSKLREEVLVQITQLKTELSVLNKRIVTDEETLRLLEAAVSQDKDTFVNLEKQIADNTEKVVSLELEISDCNIKLEEFKQVIEKQGAFLKEAEEKYQLVSQGSGDVLANLDKDREGLSQIKDKLYELQVEDKDIDYKCSAIKERMLQAYKVDLDLPEYTALRTDKDKLMEETVELKKRLDAYGTVNLVAIEEYDELKKRYDFLTQQQNDLESAKESLHQAILKINRTTKEMFLETFEKVRVEFRNYFKLLFGGGDAQLFLIDENDPLESGIEIICRPPGKKLQNVLLLSGGEKSMSAIALIFAIFKVKPSPFCVLDEIDAALDEANVDRFSRILQEFAKSSQFIVITHNKKTIANADVMYGITMEDSGVSKIVSVKFAQSKEKEKEPDALGVGGSR
jgi:chromosome segregation protein